MACACREGWCCREIGKRHPGWTWCMTFDGGPKGSWVHNGMPDGAGLCITGEHAHALR